MLAAVNRNAGPLGLPQLASSELFCVCLRWAGCHSPYLELETWSSGLCVNVPSPAYRCVCFLFSDVKWRWLQFVLFLLFLFRKDKTLKVMEYSYIILMEAKEFPPWLCRHWALFAWRATTFPLLPEYKNLSSLCDHRYQSACLIQINLVRPLQQPLR